MVEEGGDDDDDDVPPIPVPADENMRAKMRALSRRLIAMASTPIVAEDDDDDIDECDIEDSCELAGVERNGTTPCSRTSDPTTDRPPPCATTWRCGGNLTRPNDDDDDDDDE